MIMAVFKIMKMAKVKKLVLLFICCNKKKRGKKKKDMIRQYFVIPNKWINQRAKWTAFPSFMWTYLTCRPHLVCKAEARLLKRWKDVGINSEHKISMFLFMKETDDILTDWWYQLTQYPYYIYYIQQATLSQLKLFSDFPWSLWMGEIIYWDWIGCTQLSS